MKNSKKGKPFSENHSKICIFFLKYCGKLNRFNAKGFQKQEILDLMYEGFLSRTEFFQIIKKLIPLYSDKIITNIPLLLNLIQEEYNTLLKEALYKSSIIMDSQKVFIFKFQINSI